MPCKVATEFSILRATSVSICAGAAPGSAAVTVTVGKSISMNCWTFIARKDIRPNSVSMMNSKIAGVGFRIDQEETLITAWRCLQPLSRHRHRPESRRRFRRRGPADQARQRLQRAHRDGG